MKIAILVASIAVMVSRAAGQNCPCQLCPNGSVNTGAQGTATMFGESETEECEDWAAIACFWLRRCEGIASQVSETCCSSGDVVQSSNPTVGIGSSACRCKICDAGQTFNKDAVATVTYDTGETESEDCGDWQAGLCFSSAGGNVCNSTVSQIKEVCCSDGAVQGSSTTSSAPSKTKALLLLSMAMLAFA